MATILSSSSSEQRNDCPYLESLGLQHSPFTPDDESSGYLDERGNQHLNLAIHLLESSHMVVIVLGETGMGKSTLAHQLQLRLPDTILPCLINANNLTPQSLLRSMAGQLDIPQDVDLSTQRLLLAEKTVSLRHQDCVPLIIVDDAHLLDDDTLNALIQAHTVTNQEYNRWELALFSNPGLEQRLATQLPTGKENIYEIQLKPYNEIQTRDYLANRMKTAGYQSEELPFTDRQFRLLLERSNGIPARINNAAHEMLCSRSAANLTTQRTEPERTRPVVENRFPALKLQRILLIVSISLLAVILVFQEKINQLFVDEYDAISGSVTTVETTTDLIRPTNIKPGNRIADRPRPEPTTSTAQQTTPPPVSRVEHTAKTGQQAVTQADELKPEVANPFETVDSTEIPKLTLPQSGDQRTATASLQPEQPKPQVPAQTAPVSVETDTAPLVTATAKPGKPRPQKTIDEKATLPPATPVPPSASSDNKAMAISGQEWVMSRNPKHYTLQLIATTEEAQIQKYISTFKLEGRSHYYPIRYRDKLLYVLLTGEFADRASGQAAQEQLPAAIRKDKPWLRALSLIQAEIKRGHK